MFSKIREYMRTKRKQAMELIPSYDEIEVETCESKIHELNLKLSRLQMSIEENDKDITELYEILGELLERGR